MGQQIYSGKNSYTGIEKFLSDVKSKRFLLVCDSAFQFLSLKDYFSTLPVPFSVFQDFHPNPLYEEVCEGVKTFSQDSCDCIVAVGGGSAIDVAKCIKLYSCLNSSINYLEQEYEDSGVPLLALPTTAGTGSESTRFAVIYFNGEKQSVAHDSIIPNVAVLCPGVLKTLPLYQKKSTLLDAFCQAMESWWSVNSTEESIEYSKQTIQRILKYKDDYLNGKDQDAMEEIMLASNYAGRAINITQTTAAHAMSYKITSLYKIAHGHAVSLCFPVLWEYMVSHLEDCVDIRGSKYLQSIFENMAKELGANSIKEAGRYLIEFFRSFEMSVPCTTEEDLELLSSSVNLVRLKNNPVLLTKEVLLKLYRKALEQ